MRHAVSITLMSLCALAPMRAQGQAKIWENYDFVPGSKVLFYTDFLKAALVSEHAAAADRITTKGLGDTKPSTPNTTAAGRAQNRRVEIVKQ